MFVPQHLPSSRALGANAERQLAEDLRLIATKLQVAILRTLADELERCPVRGGAALAIEGQLVQELARLGCRSLETAAAMVEKPKDVTEQSGIHRVLAFLDS